jgi:hypothetical protein
MKKIKKFRVAPRPSAVLKNLKALLSRSSLTPDAEQAVSSAIEKTTHRLSTAALYETVSLDRSPTWAAPLWDARNDKNSAPVALTFYAATIGPDLEKDVADSAAQGDMLRSQVLAALGEESAEQAAHFVARLVAEEAKGESCELSARAEPSSVDIRRGILGALDADKIGVRLEDNGGLSPRYSRAGYVLWWPPAKKRK